MPEGRRRRLSRALALAVLAAAVGAAVVSALPNLAALKGFAAPLIVLALAAAATARLASSRGGARPVRLTTAFLLVAILSLPPPGATIVVLAAAAAAAGGGLAGFSEGGLRAAAANVAACSLAESLHEVFGRTALHEDTAGLLELAAVFAVLQLTAAGLKWVLDIARDPDRPGSGNVPPNLAYEFLNIPLAWLLLAQLELGTSLAFPALAAVLVLGGYGLRALDGAFREVQTANGALAARVTELATLHAIGREVLSSLDPDRVCTIIERECRKIFDVDFFFLALADRDTNEMRVIHRAGRDGVRTEEVIPVGEGFASWIMTSKRGLVIDDFADPEVTLPFRPRMIEPGIRSALAVPLIVEERAVGVLSLQSKRPRAYDDHGLSVLTTVAQQAAIALENARHYAMATVDSLTGLFLREYFFVRLEEEHNRAIRYGGSFALLMLDLDGFKAINDRYGHLAGDRYLRAFGQAVRTRLRGADLACRYGGDEFCLLLPETDLDGARRIADRLCDAIGGLAVDVGGTRVRSTVSIGLAGFPEHYNGDLKALLLRADQALYRAKHEGRDRVVLYSGEPEARTRGNVG